MIVNRKTIKKLLVALLLTSLFVINLSISVLAEEIDVFVNIYEADKNRAFIQVQNSGNRELHDVYYSIDGAQKQKLVDVFAIKSSAILLEALTPGEHTVKVESKEATVEKKIYLTKTEKELIADQNLQKQNNTLLTASQIENNPQAKKQIEIAAADFETQKKVLEEIREKNKQQFTVNAAKVSDEQQKLLELEQEALKNAEARQKKLQQASQQSQSSLQNQGLEQKKEFPATKKTDNFVYITLIIGLLLLFALFSYYLYKNPPST
ncbi:TPA: hypothetical protein HA246_04895 [Candidatus Woesearchaeota archaeon]|nr:hypothetical protein [Candidatus Woesearchaeota archaeon]